MDHRKPPILPTTSSSPPPSPRRIPVLGAVAAAANKLTRRPLRAALVGTIALLVLLYNAHAISTLRRDVGYILRPLWDTPEPAFNVIKHFPRAGDDNDEQWCGAHGWATRRGGKPVVVDAVPVSTELDMLEIRWREYAPFVDILLVVESNMTFAGTPKPLHFAAHRARFERIAHDAGAKLVYRAVTDFEPNLPSGSFKNEACQRQAISDLIAAERGSGAIPPGALIIQSDVDEIVSRDTLQLLTMCSGFPSQLHLQVDNYLYSYDQPLNDGGYWRPRVVTVPAGGEGVDYHHGRGSDDLLAAAGWHCSFCFPTLQDMRAKMTGYSHNDRLTSARLLDERRLRRRVCEGRDPFGMWAEAFTFRDVIAHSGPTRRRNAFLHVPVALKEEPERFSYLLDKGCERPNK
ncbi:Beta-1,4-mannosyl-glycoprotein 4-beta-N-acetylglucosaminyltransferase [Vanrija pseudolonga]|uniref:Beta-1,4-mannosyl-glycoprotein 4-beta-N-acetylglucosaminyltransferase n=1 Tax=Vanrija pseudolonga TaxID=143232 RepID=A0AAF0YFF7_9TREE|nr:Beta-1,4-mannosyl-glycoprotein 4-beta-N-acetylglucosaminyltransferase [Vanrija pseudolonga]